MVISEVRPCFSNQERVGFSLDPGPSFLPEALPKLGFREWQGGCP